MKRIYFVRHGESLANAGVVGMGMDASLSPKGIEQAEFIAKRCKNLPIELIVTSTLNWAKETANIINKEIKKPLETLEMFSERRLPSAFKGLSDDKWTEIRRGIEGFFYKPGFRHSDEENFEDIIERGNRCLEYIKSRPENNILIIAHGSFLRDLVALSVFKKHLTPELRRSMGKGFTTVNTGLTILTYEAEHDQWSLLTWNDHAHLG